MLRRLEKRILVDLPTLDARKAMFLHHLPHIVNQKGNGQLELISDIDYLHCARVGSSIMILLFSVYISSLNHCRGMGGE